MLAGTALFYSPIGHRIAQWVAASGVDPATLVPYSPNLYDKAAWDSMRTFRKPFAVVHLYSFYVLAVLVVLHVAAVVATEIKEGGSIVSAMFTGRKRSSRADRPTKCSAVADEGEHTGLPTGILRVCVSAQPQKSPRPVPS